MPMEQQPALTGSSGPRAWTSDTIGGGEGLTHRLGSHHVEELDRLARATLGIDVTAMDRAAFSSPLIDALMQGVREEIERGKGIVVLSGLDPQKLGTDLFTRIHWGLATHLGTMPPQSPKGDRIGFVRKEANNPDARGYQADIELRPHTDFHELLSLACISTAAEGGLSGFVSGRAVHDIMAAECSQHLPALYEGYYHDTTGEGEFSEGPVPVFGWQGGNLGVYHQALFMNTAAAQRGEVVPPALIEAMAAFESISKRPGVIAKFMLQPGDIGFWHNFAVLHARDSFTNDAQHERLILRLWINPPVSLPLPPVYLSQARKFDRLHAAGKPAIVYTKTGVKL